MQTYFITSNESKLRELRAILPRELDVRHKKLDLQEIQSLDLHEIVNFKLKQAYSKIQRPVIVEDVSAELESLNGLPGPFIKFFNERLGSDALYQLGGEGDRVRIVCAAGYYDGKDLHIADGVVNGTITAPRGEGGFGFDKVVIPEGYDKTFAEMGAEEKNKISHRFNAMQRLAKLLAAP